MVNGASHIEVDRKKAQLFAELTTLAKTKDKYNDKLSYWLHPTEIRATDRIPKGHLELVPATDLKNVTSKRGPGGHRYHCW